MSTRKVKDAKDLSSNELIYFKGHAKATYMSDGTTVEDAINNIEAGTGADLSAYATKEELSSKQDTITDLETIRQGAAKGVTALQSYTELYQGTITGVSANGISLATSGVANIPAASTSDYGVTKLSSSTSSTSTTLAATASAVKSAYDLANEKQAKLVSGTNIKTINGISILGSGDITISGDSGSSNSSSAYPLVEVETLTGHLDNGPITINPNTFYVLRGDDDIGSTGYVEIVLGEETTGVANEYLFLFTSGSTATGLTLPDNIKWTNEPNIGTNKTYLISILNGLGTILEFDV